MNGFLFGSNGAFVRAVNTMKMNNPKKNNKELISGIPINH
jgi:hypothetical protein